MIKYIVWTLQNNLRLWLICERSIRLPYKFQMLIHGFAFNQHWVFSTSLCAKPGQMASVVFQGPDNFIQFLQKNLVRILKESSDNLGKIWREHLENPKNFVKDLKKLIKKDGTFILEVEYLSNFIKKRF